MVRWFWPVCVAVALSCDGTPPPDPAPVVDDHASALPAVSDQDRAAIKARLRARDAYCVQIKSVDKAEKAKALKAAIENQTQLPVDIRPSVIKGRGTWHRVCVGALPTRAEAVKQGSAWTAAGGLLFSYTDKVKKGQAAFLIKRTSGAPVAPTDAQIGRLIEAQTTGPVHIEPRSSTSYAIAATADDVVVVDAQGVVLDWAALADQSSRPCMSCQSALQKGPVRRGEPELADIFESTKGPELLVVERVDERDTSILTVLGFPAASSPRIVARRHLGFSHGTRQSQTRWVSLDDDTISVLLFTDERLDQPDGCTRLVSISAYDRSGLPRHAKDIPLDRGLLAELLEHDAGPLVAQRAQDPVWTPALRARTARSLAMTDRLNLLARGTDPAKSLAPLFKTMKRAVLRRPCTDLPGDVPVLTELYVEVFVHAPPAIQKDWIDTLKAKAPQHHALLLSEGL